MRALTARREGHRLCTLCCLSAWQCSWARSSRRASSAPRVASGLPYSRWSRRRIRAVGSAAGALVARHRGGGVCSGAEQHGAQRRHVARRPVWPSFSRRGRCVGFCWRAPIRRMRRATGSRSSVVLATLFRCVSRLVSRQRRASDVARIELWLGAQHRPRCLQRDARAGGPQGGAAPQVGVGRRRLRRGPVRRGRGDASEVTAARCRLRRDRIHAGPRSSARVRRLPR